MFASPYNLVPFGCLIITNICLCAPPPLAGSSTSCELTLCSFYLRLRLRMYKPAAYAANIGPLWN